MRYRLGYYNTDGSLECLYSTNIIKKEPRENTIG